jgi:hypothetical protein
MWWLILLDLASRVDRPRLLEIGVYKGQVLSLWARIAEQEQIPVQLVAISPFVGNPLPRSVWVRRLKWLISRSFRESCRTGNFYEQEDYEAIVRSLFDHFGLRFDTVQVCRGYSTDPEIRAELADCQFDLIYIDGDHTFEGASSDVRWCAPRVAPNGYLVMDDASFFLPGTTFWKGYEEVSKAADLVPGFEFENILNVGHNRVFRKIPAVK